MHYFFQLDNLLINISIFLSHLVINCNIFLSGFSRLMLDNDTITGINRNHVNCKYVYPLTIEKVSCANWNCWESNLRDITRVKILHIYNSYRSQVMNGTCCCCDHSQIPTMLELKWHWELEIMALNAIKSCPNIEHKSGIHVELEFSKGTSGQKKKFETVCEYVSFTFPVTTGSQTELINNIPWLIDQNYLKDFKDLVYNRNLALYMGCAFLARLPFSEEEAYKEHFQFGVIANIVCYFCSREKHLNDVELKHCPVYTDKSTFHKYPKLCRSMDTEVIMPCEVSQVQCDSSDKTYTWMYSQPFQVTSIYFDNNTIVNRTKNSVVAKNFPLDKIGIITSVTVKVTPYVISLDKFDRKFCILICLVLLCVICLTFLTMALIYQCKIIEKH